MADLHRSTRWAGLQPGDPVHVDGTRLRGASWEFVAHITNGETGDVWVEVVGGRGRVAADPDGATTRLEIPVASFAALVCGRGDAPDDVVITGAAVLVLSGELGVS